MNTVWTELYLSVSTVWTHGRPSHRMVVRHRMPFCRPFLHHFQVSDLALAHYQTMSIKILKSRDINKPSLLRVHVTLIIGIRKINKIKGLINYQH